SSLELASRRAIEHGLAHDPLARGIALTLAGAAIVTLLLALLGLGVALVSELRDERGDLLDLAAQGVSPGTLRRQFRWRAGVVVARGALCGAGRGLPPSAPAVVQGPSGSGKTTLLRVVSGFERLSAGSAHALGVELPRLGAREIAAFRARNLGLLDQHYARSLSPDLTCRQTVAMQLELSGRN